MQSKLPITPFTVVIEVQRGTRVKYRPDGRFQYLSPFPSPFDYGYAPNVPLAADGDPQDVLILGTDLPPGTRQEVRLHGVVVLTDEGLRDDKWIVAPAGYTVSEVDQEAVRRFFRRYERMKNLWALLRLRTGVVVLDTWWRT